MIVQKVYENKFEIVEMKKTGDQYPDYEVFTYWHAFFLVGAIVTYIVDLTLGKFPWL